MEDWQKHWTELCDVFSDSVEKFIDDLEEEVSEWVEAIADTSIELSETVEELLLSDLESYFNECLELIIELDPNSSDDPFYSDLAQEQPQHSPWRQPQACIGCRNYHGQIYGQTMFVCAMHPYGWDDAACPDWDAEQ
ncbi:hypothetical protein [Roseofilum casamattae]|uniref:Uncharacterized protein n=1 Tax=Roseofilum casamattae BLCC-M143 TaxID=3022442 RepID=A0ABT7BYD1_9CYAN|nr:hypothetical protein [Roseofilum casamattae]MDJ1184211.1 hypothetical protein [Roseofilum casamattae BLCC-M143]